MDAILSSLYQPQGSVPDKVRECVLGTLGNLFAKMPELRQIVVAKGGMQLLFNLLGEFNQKHVQHGPDHALAKLIEPLLCALK